MGNDQQHGPAFWACGEATGQELWLGSSPAVLLGSIIGGYGKIGKSLAKLEGISWSEMLKQVRFAYACDLAKDFQGRALVTAREETGWSTLTESSENLDRIYADKAFVASNLGWSKNSVRLVIVHPIIAVDWEPPVEHRSLIVIDPRSEISLLRSMVRVGVLTNAGRLDARSRVEHPYGM
ncbi:MULTISPECIES: hypothetical protein [unclassified Cryobacterium]|uniref:hypothetical protein n=1 Tax=unclassified Cryobacterium TaxID=2649013 RepID=UPI00106C51F5|nr:MULTISPECIES: hypothetical protein [unclassified Cryobacterium]TFB96260.1 hypothetical protein E3O39_09140 [Cryobacterium sp. MDB2-A-1]TFC12545.1 hypothetical protein E3O35_06305 [Cryobacterium sp. MDB2-A-2]